MNVQSLLTYQPFKGLWAILALGYNATRLPLWMLIYLPSRLRQNPKWSYRQAIAVRLLRALLWNLSMIEVRVPFPLSPGAEKDRFVVLPPAPKTFFIGPALLDDQVVPGQVGATWYPGPPGHKEGDKPGNVVLYFHGGAFVVGDGRQQDAGFAAKTLLQHTDISHILSVQYRIASSKNCNFPAQLQDAISSYCHVVHNLGISPSKIIVSGDSAGGNLTLALLRYIAEHAASVGLTNPACAWLWSYWPSPYQTLKNPTQMNHHPNSKRDYVVPAFGVWGARCLQPPPDKGKTAYSPGSRSLDNPYIDLVGHQFRTEVPLFFSVGSDEVLLTDQIKGIEGFRKMEGNRVELAVATDAPHDFVLTGHLIGFQDAAKGAAIKANDFWREVSGSSGGVEAKI